MNDQLWVVEHRLKDSDVWEIDNAGEIDLPAAFATPLSAEKLCVEHDGIYRNSGIQHRVVKYRREKDGL